MNQRHAPSKTTRQKKKELIIIEFATTGKKYCSLQLILRHSGVQVNSTRDFNGLLTINIPKRFLQLFLITPLYNVFSPSTCCLHGLSYPLSLYSYTQIPSYWF